MMSASRAWRSNARQRSCHLLCILVIAFFQICLVSSASTNTILSCRERSRMATEKKTPPSSVLITTAANAKSSSTASSPTTVSTCAGVLISPSFVLAPTACIEHLLLEIQSASASSSPEADLAVVPSVCGPNDDDLNSVPVESIKTSDQRPIGLSSQLADSGRIETKGSIDRSLVVLHLARALLDYPVATLATRTPRSADATRFSLLRPRHAPSLCSLLPSDRCVAALRPRAHNSSTTEQPPTSWVCVETVSNDPTGGMCSADRRADQPDVGFLVSGDSLDAGVVWGVALVEETTCDYESVGHPSTTPVVAMVSARKFVDNNVQGHNWLEDEIRPTMRPAPTSTSTPTTTATATPSTTPTPTSTRTLTPTTTQSSNDGAHGSGSSDSFTKPPTPKLTHMPTSTPRPTLPPSSTETGSSSGSAHGSTSVDIEAPVQPTQPSIAPQWLTDKFVMITKSRFGVNETDDATIGYFITPRHVLLHRRLYFGDASALRWVTLSSHEQIAIKKLWFENQYFNKSDALQGKQRDGLVIAELESTLSDVVPRTLQFGQPRFGYTYEDVEVTVFDDVLSPSRVPLSSDEEQTFPTTWSRQVMKFGNSSSCGTDNLCGVLEKPEEPTEPHKSPIKKAVAEVRSELIGFARELRRSSDGSISLQIEPLSTPRHRDFINGVTTNMVKWASKNAFKVEEQNRAQRATFMVTLTSREEDGHSVRCKGILISQDFVLTAASCLKVAVSFVDATVSDDRGRPHAVDVRPDYQIMHPYYETEDDKLWDIAIIGLASPAIDAKPIALNPGTQGTLQIVTDAPRAHVVLYGIQSQDSKEVSPPASEGASPPEYAPAEACANTTTTRRKTPVQARGVCVKRAEPMLTRLIGKSGDKLIRVLLQRNNQSSPSAVGLEAPLSPDNIPPVTDRIPEEGTVPEPKPTVFVSFAENANFINAYATGHSWGQAFPDGFGAPQPPSLLPPSPSPVPSYVVGLRLTKDGQNFCGGSLIGPYHVLTAAHCVGDGLVKWVSIGSRESAGLETEPIAIYQDKIKAHPSFGSPFAFSFDAAILELQTAAYARGVLLDESVDFSHAPRATMYGYGVLGPYSNVLSPTVRILDLPLLSKKDCTSILPNIDDSVLCAGGEGKNDACKGDSGGPLVLSKSEDVLVGLVSAGYGCGIDGVPGMYTRISSLRNFIDAYAVGVQWGVPSDKPSVVPSPTPTRVKTMAPTTAPPDYSQSPSTAPPQPTPTLNSGSLQPYSNEQTGSSSRTEQPPAPSKGAFDSPVNSKPVPRKLPPALREALMRFFLGEMYDGLQQSSGPLSGLLNPTNDVQLYSSGNLGSIEDLLMQRSSWTLYTRRDRFGTMHSSSSKQSPTSERC
ncbi:hypothetical protein PINS_up002723 [Pythium insidiosum]|nr:hypothetical protein PINS_up002723 [Pythium insidiosum]